MDYSIEFLEAELDSLKDAWREDEQWSRDIYISKIIDVKEAICHLKKINKQDDNEKLLLNFMEWLSNDLNKKDKKMIVDFYLKNK